MTPNKFADIPELDSSAFTYGAELYNILLDTWFQYIEYSFITTEFFIKNITAKLKALNTKHESTIYPILALSQGLREINQRELNYKNMWTN